MKEKFVLVFKEVIKRFKSPIVWAGIISVVGLIFTTVGASYADVATWEGLKVVLIGIVTSPAKIGMIVVALYSFLNNPTTKEKF